ncbi:MAP6 domain-containing protein 1 [Alligator mississippiensis]|uniref:MAP6 domain-containing protein 1 n=1 Tax=Alligator mississippiensis TaxID=8496 RepID=UPI002877A564|nr:MAP6 domain-containing protein 1 [Alligator mississippiensis]
MAWPCISRVCCLARLWGQLDKSDLAVPLTLRSYSDIDEPPPPAGPAAPSPPETQYRRDFRAWPLPRRPPAAAATSSPWPGGREGGAVYVLPAAEPARPRAARPPRSPCPPAAAATSSYRQEYRPWTGAKPSKPIKTKQGFIIPEGHFVQETSYRADFKIPEAKTKFSPNPSAVFQAPSRILNV